MMRRGSKIGVVLTAILGLQACSSSQTTPLEPMVPVIPVYSEIPHPEGLDQADVHAIFFDRQAPKRESLKGCDDNFRKLRAATQVPGELNDGAREMVKADPVKYHWCFYSKLLELDEFLKQNTFIDEREKKITEAFLFLTPMSRAFMVEYQDSRYLRWAITRYRNVSVAVLSRKVDLTAQTQAELTDYTPPFAANRPVNERGSILERYRLKEEPAPRKADEERSPLVNAVNEDDDDDGLNFQTAAEKLSASQAKNPAAPEGAPVSPATVPERFPSSEPAAPASPLPAPVQAPASAAAPEAAPAAQQGG